MHIATEGRQLVGDLVAARIAGDVAEWRRT